MKNEMQKIRHTIWAVGFFLATVYLLHHEKYAWGIFSMIAMVFYDLSSSFEDEGR